MSPGGLATLDRARERAAAVPIRLVLPARVQEPATQGDSGASSALWGGVFGAIHQRVSVSANWTFQDTGSDAPSRRRRVRKYLTARLFGFGRSADNTLYFELTPGAGYSYPAGVPAHRHESSQRKHHRHPSLGAPPLGLRAGERPEFRGQAWKHRLCLYAEHHVRDIFNIRRSSSRRTRLSKSLLGRGGRVETRTASQQAHGRDWGQWVRRAARDEPAGDLVGRIPFFFGARPPG